MVSKVEAAEELLRRRNARSNIKDFTLYTKTDYKLNWHHELIFKKLDELASGKSKRAIINCPPRHGKSESVSRRYPAYLLGRNPDLKIISCSYSADLAQRMNRDVQRIIDSPEYKVLFPDTQLNSSNVRTTAQGSFLRNSDIFEIVNHDGVYRSAGVGGGITGMGGNCLTGDTEIITNFGTKRLDSVVKSFKYNKRFNYWYRVLSYDHDKQKPVWRRIKAARHLRSSRILEITTSSGYKIRVTPEHRIFVKDAGYTEAHRLQPGDRVYYSDKPEKQSLPILRNYSKGKRGTLSRLLSKSSKGFSSSQMLSMWEGIREKTIRLSKMVEERTGRYLLLNRMFESSPCSEKREIMRDMWYPNAWKEREQILLPRVQKEGIRSEDRERCICSQRRLQSVLKTHSVSGMWDNIQTTLSSNYLLLKRLCRQITCKKDDRHGEFKLQTWKKLFENVPGNEATYIGKRSAYMRGMWKNEENSFSASCRWKQEEQLSGKPHLYLQNMPCSTPQVCTDTISSITDISCGEVEVYDLQIEGNHNFFANQILVHNCLIIDDPIKNREEAESPTIQEKIWEWYTDVFYTRQEENASILITQTRWHKNDLTGKLLKLASEDPDADQWDVINLPALSEEVRPEYDQRKGPDEALWRGKYPETTLKKIKATVPAYTWLSLYQQRPIALSGNLVRQEQFKYCTIENGILNLEENKKFLLTQCRIFQTCDPAASEKSSADYFALGTWAQTPHNDLALIDLIHTRLEFPQQISLFKQQYQLYHPVTQYVGTKGLGISLFQALRTTGLPVVKVEEESDKVSRFITACDRIASGTVYFRADLPKRKEYETELLDFPKGEHDDLVDITSTAVHVIIFRPFKLKTYKTTNTGIAVSDAGIRI